MTTSSTLLASTASAALPGPMSVAERSKGRYMRDESGHAPSPTPAPAPAPTPAPAPAPSEFVEATAESLDAEFAPTPEGGSSTDETGGAPPAAKPEDAPKPEGASVEERIGALTAAQREAERQAAEARREADELRRKYEPAPKEEQPSAEGQAPDPGKYEFGEADPKFIADTARFHAKMEYQEQAAQAKTRAQIAGMEAKWQGEIAKPELVERYPDFDDKVTKGAESGAWDCSPLMALGIKQSPVGPDVAYHLATNTSDAARIAKLSPIEQALEFGRLEGKFIYAPKSGDKPPVSTTSAPPPPAARARGAGGQFATNADTDDFAAFDKMADGVLHKG